MLCYRCGHNVPDRAMKCSNCGAELGSATRAMKIPRGSIKALRQRRAKAESTEVPFKEGDLIAGRYEVRGTLGRGPFGAVFKTFDQEIETEVAVKVVNETFVADDASRARFEEAVRQARRLSHQNIVRLYDNGFDQGWGFVAMQLLEGLNLRKMLHLRHDKQEPYSLAEVEPLLEQMVRALSYCHRTGAHGALRPENIVLQPDKLKITDFFIFDGVGQEGFVKAQSDSVYMAPELKDNPDSVGPRSDVYSVGVMIAELLAGRFFEGAVEMPQAHNPALPDQVDMVLGQATAKDPEDRYDSLEALGEALSAASEVIENFASSDVLEVTEEEGLSTDTAVYKLDPEEKFDPLDIPTPLDIGEGPRVDPTKIRGETSPAIVIGEDDALEIVEIGDEDVDTTAMAPLARPEPPADGELDSDTVAMPPLERPGAPKAPSEPETPPSPEPAPPIDELETIEQPRNGLDLIPPGGKKKGFMKPVDKTPEADKPAIVVPRSTDRVKALPKTKPRGEAVKDERQSSFTVVLAVLSIFLLIGVISFVVYGLDKTNRTSEVIEGFGQKTAETAPADPGKKN